MKEDKKTLGDTLREARVAQGLSTREVARLAGVDQATVVRIENGTYMKLRPDRLARLASALGLSADIFALANITPNDLPSFRPYLRSKYGQLAEEDVASIERYAARIAKRRGVSLDGPAPGEDE